MPLERSEPATWRETSMHTGALMSVLISQPPVLPPSSGAA